MDLTEIEEHPNGSTSIDINLEDPEKLYLFMDILRENGAIIESIDKQDVNFEEVFLQLVSREA